MPPPLPRPVAYVSSAYLAIRAASPRTAKPGEQPPWERANLGQRTAAAHDDAPDRQRHLRAVGILVPRHVEGRERGQQLLAVDAFRCV